MTYQEWQDWTESHRLRFNMGRENERGDDIASQQFGEWYAIFCAQSEETPRGIGATHEEMTAASVWLWLDAPRSGTDALQWSEHPRLMRAFILRKRAEAEAARRNYEHVHSVNPVVDAAVFEDFKKRRDALAAKMSMPKEDVS